MGVGGFDLIIFHQGVRFPASLSLALVFCIVKLFSREVLRVDDFFFSGSLFTVTQTAPCIEGTNSGKGERPRPIFRSRIIKKSVSAIFYAQHGRRASQGKHTARHQSPTDNSTKK